MAYSASIIIPVYNSALTLKKCVESLVFGSFSNIQIILSEDQSADDSWNICKELSNVYSNVFCVRNEVNSGVSHTRNRGLELAKGEFILFVDSDDWVSGKYVEKMISAASQHPAALPICGLHYCDYVANNKKDYVFDPKGEKTYLLGLDQLFTLSSRFQLQQIWNKAFRRDIIEKNHLRFDETQSMGEDFQFVLDYLEASAIKQLFVLNEPLYYYIRANNSSLMSKFGVVENDYEFRRLKQILRLAGEDKPEVKKSYTDAVANTKHNYMYQAVHYKPWTRYEKLAFIEKVMGDGKAKNYYREQNRVLFKENLVGFIKQVRQLFHRFKGKLNRVRRETLIRRSKRRLNTHDFSVISQNCIGGVFYHDMGLQFTSPTINLFFTCPDFVKFVLSMDHYLGMDLRMTWGEEYPIGYLDDIAVFFQHYETCSEAKEKWETRKSRIKKDRIVVLCTDRDGFNENAYEQWKHVKYPSILFSALKRVGCCVVYYPQYGKEGRVGDLITNRDFYKDGTLINLLNRMG